MDGYSDMWKTPSVSLLTVQMLGFLQQMTQKVEIRKKKMIYIFIKIKVLLEVRHFDCDPERKLLLMTNLDCILSYNPQLTSLKDN